MDEIQQLISHPAGKIGLTVGLAIGVLAALIGEAKKALFIVSLCHLLASRAAH